MSLVGSSPCVHALSYLSNSLPSHFDVVTETLQALSLIRLHPSKEQSACTLVVCPKSVMSNWLDQSKAFFNEGALRVERYEGPPSKRTRLIKDVQAGIVDVLIASYDVIRSEYKARFHHNGEKCLRIHDLTKFHRIVIDEAHIIRNPKSKTFKAVMSMADKSANRLAITGTPVVNSPDDVFALLAFIGIRPLDDWATFKARVSTVIKQRSRAGLLRLRAALKYGSLRRTKEGLMDEMQINYEIVKFPEGNQKNVYDHFYRMGRALVSSPSPSVKIFTVMMHLRRSCDDARLVAEPHDELGVSPKLLVLLKRIKEMASDEKGVIFSQWTGFLDLIGDALQSAGYKYVRLDGSMAGRQRQEAIEALKNDENVRFMLSSLKAGGVGVNLERANVVFVMDPWWNKETELQAYNRVHRIGQTRQVRVHRMMMKDTVEENMYALQEKKSVLSRGTLKELTPDEERLTGGWNLCDLFHDMKNSAVVSQDGHWTD